MPSTVESNHNSHDEVLIIYHPILPSIFVNLDWAVTFYSFYTIPKQQIYTQVTKNPLDEKYKRKLTFW